VRMIFMLDDPGNKAMLGCEEGAVMTPSTSLSFVRMEVSNEAGPNADRIFRLRPSPKAPRSPTKAMRCYRYLAKVKCSGRGDLTRYKVLGIRPRQLTRPNSDLAGTQIAQNKLGGALLPTGKHR